MELSKKTTILLSPKLHRRLSRLAKDRGVSMGHLIRDACETQYGTVPLKERLKAIEEMARMRLPVSDVATMKRQSVPHFRLDSTGARPPA